MMQPLRSPTRSLRLLLHALCLVLAPASVFAQSTVLQGGPFSPGQVPTYSSSGGSQAVVQSAGPAGGGAAGIGEIAVIARGNGNGPFAGQGSGPQGTINCTYDGPTSSPSGYHYLCLSANAQGGGLLSYGNGGAASTLPFNFRVNGTTYAFPFVTGGIVGPGTTVVGHIATWNNTTGTLLADGGAALTIGGTNGQLEYNNAGALGGFTMAGDCTLSVPNIACSKIGGQNVSLGGALTTGGPLTTAGASSLTLTTSGVTNVSFPASGTLATLDGSEALTNKTVNGLTISPTTGGTLTISNNKVFVLLNSLGYAGTDGSTLNIGAGGTLGTAAYVANLWGSQITNSLAADVNLSNAALYFTGPTVAQGTTGTWFASGAVTLFDSAGGNTTFCKLWDGTTVIASGVTVVNFSGSGTYNMMALSGYLANPAGNIRISCRDTGSTTGLIISNQSGNSKDSTLSAFRVN